jgi:hypothetical protein
MRRFLTALIITLALPITATAQTTPGVFTSYDQMLATLDPLMQTRQIVQLLTVFGGQDEMTPQDMTALEIQVRNLFPNDFTNVAVMQRMEMENGFAQELVAYWDDQYNYIYVRLLTHQLEDGTLTALNMTFNSDINVLLPLF